MLHYALGCGVKGLNYFLRGSDRKCLGYENSPELEDQITALNIEVRTAAPWLSVGQSIRGVVSAPPGVWVRTLLCGERGMVLVLVNEQYKSTEQGFRVDPIRNLALDVEMPHWLTIRAVSQMTSQGPRDVDFIRKDNRVRVNVNELRDAQLIILAANPQQPKAEFDRVVGPKRRREEAVRVMRAVGEGLLSKDHNPPGLIAAWYLHEGQGLIIHDASGNNNAGVMAGATWGKVPDGYAHELDGKNDYIEIPSSKSLSTTDAVTVELWYKAQRSGILISRGSDFLEVSASPTRARFRLLTYPQGEKQHYLLSHKTDPDRWHHLVATYSRKEKQMRLYLNGHERANRNQSGGMKRSDQNWYIGQRGHEYGGFFKGIIKQIRLYNRALTSEEVRYRYDTSHQEHATADSTQ